MDDALKGCEFYKNGKCKIQLFDNCFITECKDVKDCYFRQNLVLNEKFKIAIEAISRFRCPCTDCRFYHDCDRKGECRTRTNFEFGQVLVKIGVIE